MYNEQAPPHHSFRLETEENITTKLDSGSLAIFCEVRLIFTFFLIYGNTLKGIDVEEQFLWQVNSG
jgi:hypothetical protein